jgi:putative Mg2+ transporter-C (MgtC) family protein
MSIVPTQPPEALGDTLVTLRALVIAYALALPIGRDRETASHSAGLRTFPLVAVATCGFVLVGVGANQYGGHIVARTLAGIISGIGFVGAGAILKRKGSVSGMATASAIWVTGAIGAATAFGRFEIALALSAVTYLTFKLATRVKDDLPDTDNDAEP